MTTPEPNYNWHTEDISRERRHEAIWHWAKTIRMAQDYQRIDDLLHASLYGSKRRQGFSPGTYSRPASGRQLRLSLNVIRNVIGTIVSKHAAKNKLKATFDTFGGDAALRARAEGMEKLCDGIAYANKDHRTQRASQRDACIYGHAFRYVYGDKKRKQVRHVMVPKPEIIVDDTEAMYGDPPRIARMYYMDRGILRKYYPDADDAIKNAQTYEDAITGPPDRTCDYVSLVLAHHRPSVEPEDPNSEDHDGLWCLTTSAGVLDEGPWPYDRLPYAGLKWTADSEAFFGTGVAFELAGVQAEINELLQEIQKAHRLIKGHWAVEQGAKVRFEHINDDLAAIVKYAGLAPTYYAPSAIAPDVYQHLWNLYEKAYEIVGMPRLAASAEKPAGLNSGIAIRKYAQIGNERQLDAGMNLEDYVIDTVELDLIHARELAKDGDFTINARTKNGLEKINLKEVDLKKDQYSLRVFPTSMLPDEPEGKLATVGELIDKKMIDEEDGFDLLQFPDFEAYQKRRSAPKRLIERNLDKIMVDGEWVSPDPDDNHDLAVKLTTEKLAEARLDAVAPERVKLLRKYKSLSVKLQSKKNAALAPPPPPPPPPQMAGGGAPPLQPPVAA